MSKNASTARTYLAVPYAQKDEAKRAGASWSTERRLWYTEKLTDELRRWVPDSFQSPRIESNPRNEFRAIMQSIGLVAEKDHPIPDGRRHRVPTTCDKRGRKSGFYILHVDGLPAGYTLNHRTGEAKRWHANVQLSEEEKASLRVRAAEQAERHQRQLEASYAKVAAQCREALGHLTPLKYGDATPYLIKKGVVAHRGLYRSEDGETTYVPMVDGQGRLQSMQEIHANGDKRYLEGGRVAGCFHPLGGRKAFDHAARRGIIVLAEGYATAATVREVTNNLSTPIAVASAFHANNLPHVAKALRHRYANTPLVIAADDDRKNKVNAGRKYAEQAAQESRGTVIYPPFTEQHPLKLSDWNDIDQHPLTGYDRNSHRQALRQGITTAHTQQQRHIQHAQNRPSRSRR